MKNLLYVLAKRIKQLFCNHFYIRQVNAISYILKCKKCVKIITFFLAILMLSGCGQGFIDKKNYPLVITSVYQWNGNEKYKYNFVNLNYSLYSDSLYQVGDILIITKK